MADRSLQMLVSPDQPVHQCRDIFLRQLNSAVEELDGNKPNIHGARKQLKRARATLRLLRAAIGDEAYRRENIAARDAARPLSRARDEEVLSGAVEGLVAHFGEAAAGIRIRQTARQPPTAPVSDSKSALRKCMTRPNDWQVDGDGWESIASGLRATYRRGRRALRKARKDRATDDLHEWRKQAKYLWHQLQVVTPMAPGPVGELADQFHLLADYLGDEHDLAVLRGRTSGPATEIIDRRREELQDKALALGERVYAEKSKAFVHELEKHWSGWQHG